MKKICFEVDDQLLTLAMQWYAIEQTIIPKNYHDMPENDRLKIFKKLQIEWEAWTKLHNLVVKEKPLRICGMKVPRIKIKDYQRLKDVLALIGIFARHEYGIIKRTK